MWTNDWGSMAAMHGNGFGWGGGWFMGFHGLFSLLVLALLVFLVIYAFKAAFGDTEKRNVDR